jgi:hypothetical protein
LRKRKGSPKLRVANQPASGDPHDPGHAVALPQQTC